MNVSKSCKGMARSPIDMYGNLLRPVFLIGLFTSAAMADTHYVDITSKRPVKPFATWETAAQNIHDAVAAASSGDTVLVGDGIYEITKPIGVSKGKTVRSLNGSSATTVASGGKCRVFSLNANSGPVILDGFTITGGYADHEWCNGGGVSAAGKDPLLISNCIIEENESPAQGGGIFIGASKGVIANCVVRNNRAAGVGGGIYPELKDDSSGSITIKNCTIVGNKAVKGGGVGRLTPAPIMPNIKVVDCIVFGNSEGGVFRVNAYNCILYKNNISFGDDSGCRTANPKFVDVRKGNYRLKADSRCIDAGAALNMESLGGLASDSPVDLDGNPRIVDGNRDGKAVVDIGAYEYQIIRVEIDIKPGSKSDSVNLKAQSLLPVAILTTETFNASSINATSVRFAEAPPARRMLQDVDQDGDLDLLLEFHRRKLKLAEDSTRALLTGETKDKQPFIGEAAITVVR